MPIVHVPVMFEGHVTVEMPESVPTERQRILAVKLALARVLATVETSDSPEDDACCEYETETGIDDETARRDWVACKTPGVGGRWFAGDELDQER